jgi:cytochrome c oxidase subunit 2
MVNGWQHLSGSVDDIFFFIVGICVTLLTGVTGVMLYFVVRYSRKRNPDPEDVKDNLLLEIIWTVIPTLLVLVMFWVGWKGFQYMRTAPPDAMLVKVTGRMWTWSFEYENGKQSTILNVPVRRPVKLAITSADVLHSLFIPAYRIKEDAVPGRETRLWFLPDEVGSYDLFCTEYCGVGHSTMITKVAVMTQKDFDAWYKSEAPALPAGAKKLIDGAALIKEKGCAACHSLDGTAKVGPTLKGVYGRKETVVTEGKEREITADETYLRRSLLEPQADVVKGFPPIMPSQKGALKDTEIDAIILYLKDLQ